MYNYVNDKDDALVAKASGNFGLNTGTLSKIEFTDIAGKDKSAGNAVDITFSSVGKEFRRRIYEITGEVYAKNGQRVGPGQEGYDEALKTNTNQNLAVITHAVKAVGVTDEQLKRALSVEIKSFTEWVKIVIGLLPQNYTTVPVDAFLQYQEKPSEGQDRTFLELAKNMKGGYFLCPSVPCVGTWEAVRDAEGLHYVDNSGAIHPLKKEEGFLKRPIAAPYNANGITPSANGTTMNASAPAPTTWK